MGTRCSQRLEADERVLDVNALLVGEGGQVLAEKIFRRAHVAHLLHVLFGCQQPQFASRPPVSPTQLKATALLAVDGSESFIILPNNLELRFERLPLLDSGGKEERMCLCRSTLRYLYLCFGLPESFLEYPVG